MSNRQDDALPVVAYLRATKSGEPVWDEDCVCQDPVYPADPDGSDSDCISMPMVRLSDAQSVIASLQARLDAAEADAARWQWARKQFRVFSLDMGGNHSYMATAPFGRIKGPSIDAAVDAAIEAARSAA